MAIFYSVSQPRQHGLPDKLKPDESLKTRVGGLVEGLLGWANGRKFRHEHTQRAKKQELCINAQHLSVSDPPFSLSYYNDGVSCYVSRETGDANGASLSSDSDFSYCFAYSDVQGQRVYGGGDTNTLRKLFLSLDLKVSKPRLCALNGCNCPFNDPCVGIESEKEALCYQPS